MKKKTQIKFLNGTCNSTQKPEKRLIAIILKILIQTLALNRILPTFKLSDLAVRGESNVA